MKIIIRSCGERTEKKCIELAKKQGDVSVIKNITPFGAAIKQTYLKALTFKNEKWVCVIDADVQLYPGTLKKAINELERLNRPEIFCLDGKTDDKIFMHARRAGIHIYRIKFLKKALEFIKNNHIKPESNVRRKMEKIGFPTYVSRIVFGKHDFDQYYADLWRKAVCQTLKLARKIRNRPHKWAQLAKTDPDFRVIYNAHMNGKNFCNDITIDKNKDYNAQLALKKLGLKEKGELI